MKYCHFDWNHHLFKLWAVNIRACQSKQSDLINSTIPWRRTIHTIFRKNLGTMLIETFLSGESSCTVMIVMAKYQKAAKVSFYGAYETLTFFFKLSNSLANIWNCQFNLQKNASSNALFPKLCESLKEVVFNCPIYSRGKH